MSGQTWTPAPKRGIIPLHPMTFGMLLGKSFAALRHNPKVLFGFAVLVQLAVLLVGAVVLGFVFFAMFSRLQTVTPSSPDFAPILAGTLAGIGLAVFVFGLLSVAFTSIVQGLVAADVASAVLGEKPRLGVLWRRMAPAFWRLAGFSLLAVAAFVAVFLIVFGIGMGVAASGADPTATGVTMAIVILVLAIGSIPLTVWLSTKLLLVPSVLVLERARFKDALVRSWRLTRGRFWVAFGVVFIIGMIMGVAVNVVSFPLSFLSVIIQGIITPTGDPEVGAIVGVLVVLLLGEILVMIIQAISLVVQSTAGTLVYLDSRMRYEGLDQALIAHAERRELGWPDDQLGDPFAVDPARAVSSAPPPAQMPDWAIAQAAYAAQQGYAVQPGYPVQQAYPVQQGYPALEYPAQGYAAPQSSPAAQGHPAPGYAAAPPPYAPAPASVSSQPPAEPPADPWAPPSHS